mmetsp:Transcript_42260/g.99165  ORF Transcript_42260/g.99165 Transcript_42260/m.99165 type:complete len:93 (+) Transcript_42260:2642-2920(+)
MVKKKKQRLCGVLHTRLKMIAEYMLHILNALKTVLVIFVSSNYKYSTRHRMQEGFFCEYNLMQPCYSQVFCKKGGHFPCVCFVQLKVQKKIW